MIDCFCFDRLRDIPELASGMFSHRQMQFITRQNWNLKATPLGHEFDEYDDKNSTYIIAHVENTHLASLRLRSLRHRSMLTDKFGRLLLNSPPIDQGAYEVSRYCVSPHLGNLSTVVSSNLFRGAIDFARENECQSIVGLFSKSMETIYRRHSVVPKVLSETELDGDAICLGLWDESNLPPGASSTVKDTKKIVSIG